MDQRKALPFLPALLGEVKRAGLAISMEPRHWAVLLSTTHISTRKSHHFFTEESNGQTSCCRSASQKGESLDRVHNSLSSRCRRKMINQDSSPPKEPQCPNATWFLCELLSAQNFVRPVCILVCYPQYGYLALPCRLHYVTV